MKKVLVIIDMQPDFEASRGKKILDEHLYQIKKAISNKDLIIVLEFGDCCPTNKKIVKSLKYYPHVKYITKKQCSGSAKIVQYLKKQSTWPKEINFMGVNTTECVFHTVVNFNHHIKRNNKKTKIKIIKNGCRCMSSSSFGDFSIFDKYKKIEII